MPKASKKRMDKEEVDLEAAIQQHKELSDKTKKNYQEKVRVIVRRSEGKTITHILLHPATYIPLIKRWYPSIASHKAHYSALLALFKYNDAFKEQHKDAYEKWLDAFRTADRQVMERYEENSPSQRQAAGYVPFATIVEERDKLPEGHMHRLLLGFYTHIKPLRAELCRTAIYKSKVPKDAEPNYVLVEGKKATLVVRHFKTRRHHDALHIDLPEPLVKDLLVSLKELPRDWLFMNAKNEPYSQPLFSQWTTRVFQQIFKKPLTLQLVRHSYISSLDFNQMSIREKREIATSMAHTVPMQDRYRLLFDNSKESCDCVCTPKAAEKTT